MLNKIRARIAQAIMPTASRAYAAAQISRLSSDWRTFLSSADEEIWRGLRVLRARSRSLLRDDDYFKNYVRKLKNNVIGHRGMTMKVEAQLMLPGQTSSHGNAKAEKDRVLNKAVETAWVKWCKPEFASASGKLSFCDIQRLAAEALAVDGEFFFRYIFSPNGFGFSLQQLDPDLFDENFSQKLPNGNNVVMSVEMDVYDRPVAYYVTPPRHSYFGVVRDNGISYNAQRVRIDASEILHGFIALRPGQTRGVPMAHTALSRIKDLDRYENAEIINASVSAAKMGFLSPDVNDQSASMLNADGTGRKQPPILDRVEPGTIQQLPAGWRFETFDPKSPTNVFSAFCKQILRGVASGLGVSYNSLANDLEGVNYSSLRQGALEERDEWKALQWFFVEHFFQPIYQTWIVVAVGSPFLSVTPSNLVKISDPKFRPRGWDWVDPEKDANANAVELAAGTTTYTDICAEKGMDFEDTMERIKYERDFITSLDLNFVYGTGKVPALQDGDSETDGGQQSASGTGSSGASKPSQGSSTNKTGK